MRLCLAIPEIDTGLVRDVCTALANYNARTYRCAAGQSCTRDPWSVRYNESAGDSKGRAGEGPVLVMRDAVDLVVAGSGACGELAAAYVGWLDSRNIPAAIEVIDTGKDGDGVQTWHVVARIHGGRHGVIDPARPETVYPWRAAYGVR